MASPHGVKGRAVTITIKTRGPVEQHNLLAIGLPEEQLRLPTNCSSDFGSAPTGGLPDQSIWISDLEATAIRRARGPDNANTKGSNTSSSRAKAAGPRRLLR